MSSSGDSDGDSLRVICGPTAAGKSALAMALAEREHLAIISADSRQIYRGFDIGTAKPSADEQRRVPHFGIDVVDPETRYSAAAWAAAVPGWIAAAQAVGRTPLVVGGTGFYLRALATPLFEEPPLDPARRRALADWLGRLPVTALRSWCQALDPARAHLGRAQLLRALEVALLTGRRLSDLHAAAPRAPALTLRYLVVDPPPGDALRRRIERRVAAMFDAGWAEEVRGLLERVPADAPAWQASGYGAVRDLVRGAIDRRDAEQRITVATRQYAKRQRTWFRHQLPDAAVVRADPGDPRVDTIVQRWWHDA